MRLHQDIREKDLVREIWPCTWVAGILMLSKVKPRPTVKSTFAHPSDVVRDKIIAQTITLVD